MNFRNFLLEMPIISRSGKQVMADDKPLKTAEEADNNIVLFRESRPNSLFRLGTMWLYFMDSEESAKEMKEGKIPMLVIPQGAGFRLINRVDPITSVWTKEFYQKGTDEPRERMENGKPVLVDGTNKVLGILEGHSDENIIYINMMSVRPGFKRNSVNSKMITYVKNHFPQAKLEFSKPTDDGKKFINSFTGDKIKISKDSKFR